MELYLHRRFRLILRQGWMNLLYVFKYDRKLMRPIGLTSNERPASGTRLWVFVDQAGLMFFCLQGKESRWERRVLAAIMSSMGGFVNQSLLGMFLWICGWHRAGWHNSWFTNIKDPGDWLLLCFYRLLERWQDLLLSIALDFLKTRSR